ncbi:MAG: purine-nucleoside phosphorylase [Gemmatimonadota bacterium]
MATETAEAADFIRARVGDVRPRVGLVLGSGLGAFADRVKASVRIPFEAIPHFPNSTVPGHEGALILGALADESIVVQSGRFHSYEGHSAELTTLAVRTMAALGVDALILTNAAGGIRPQWRPGALMLVSDFLNLTWLPASVAPTVLNELWMAGGAPLDRDLHDRARAVARDRGIALEEGVYAGLTGPSYETRAEVRMLAGLGADAVGMSTVLEVLQARALGVRCLAISTITNLACGVGSGILRHDDVRKTATLAADRLGSLLEGIVEAIHRPL